MELVAHSPEETMAIAAAVGELLRPGDLLNLIGELGAGKTLFVKGLAGALGIAEDLVTSPTFSIVNEYEGGAGCFTTSISTGSRTSWSWRTSAARTTSTAPAFQ